MRSHLQLLVVTALAVAVASPAWAVPAKFNQQGRLLDTSGQPLTGTHALVFALYDASTGGVQQWSESHSTDFDNGYYTVTLGDVTPLDHTLFSGAPLWLEIAVDGVTLEPRQEVAAVPWALRAISAERVDGGVVDAASINIGGAEVINSSGAWVGPTPSVDWTELSGVPSDIADGDQDSDSLASLSCTEGQVAKWTAGAWACAPDTDTDTNTQLSETQVEDFVTNEPLALASGSTLGGVAITPGPHTVNTDTLASLSCPAPGDRLEWDGSTWICGAGSSLPAGVILMWSGDPATIPSGWALCDGSNGTPDLLGRFVRGTDSSTELPGTTGGDDTYTLSVLELPSHSHGVNDPGHSHGASSQSGNDGGAGANSHPHSSGSTGSSGTGISITPAGDGQPFDNRPAYYELAYIMKL